MLGAFDPKWMSTHQQAKENCPHRSGYRLTCQPDPEP
jgi:hypothetical protein